MPEARRDAAVDSAATVEKDGVATRPDSIFRRVSGDTRAIRAVQSIERSTSAGVSGNLTMGPNFNTGII